MRKIEVVSADRSPAAGGDGASHFPVSGRVSGPFRRRCASPPGASIWMDEILLEAGASIRWNPSHGDEALFVVSGELAVLDEEGRICPAGGAIVIEAQAGSTVEARVESRVIHMGACEDDATTVGVSRRSPPDPQDRPESKVHVIGPRGTFEALEPGRETRFFADATCPTCSLWLLYTARSFAYESPVHSHSQDELIHVLRGEIRIGSLAAGPGASIFIAANQRYQFRAGPDGFAFLNYRRAGSEMTIRGACEKIIEAGIATGMTPVPDSKWHAS